MKTAIPRRPFPPGRNGPTGKKAEAIYPLLVNTLEPLVYFSPAAGDNLRALHALMKSVAAEAGSSDLAAVEAENQKTGPGNRRPASTNSTPSPPKKSPSWKAAPDHAHYVPASQIEKAFAVWPQVREPALRMPHNDREYRQLQRLLDRLIDDVGENEGHPPSPP